MYNSGDMNIGGFLAIMLVLAIIGMISLLGLLAWGLSWFHATLV